MDISKLEFKSHMPKGHHYWVIVRNILNMVEIGSTLVIDGEPTIIKGVQDGRVLVHHPKTGEGTIDPIRLAEIAQRQIYGSAKKVDAPTL